MRIRSENTRILLGQRPFAGSLGASLYVGPEDAIRYRRGKVYDPVSDFWPISTTATIDPGAAAVPKTQAVAQVSSPTHQFNYTLPAALVNVPISVNVRTFQGDYENETDYRSVVVSSDGGGDQVDVILGTATIISTDKRDAGGMLLRFAYAASLSGLQPTEFALVQTSGPGSLADVVVTALARYNTIEVTGLTNATAYGWRLEARNGTVTANLGTVTFTADAAGPADPTGVVAVVL